MSVVRLKGRLARLEERLRPQERHGIVFVARWVVPGTGREEPPIPEGHVRVYLGEEFVDVPQEQVEEWLAEHVDEGGLVIWI